MRSLKEVINENSIVIEAKDGSIEQFIMANYNIDGGIDALTFTEDKTTGITLVDCKGDVEVKNTAIETLAHGSFAWNNVEGGFSCYGCKKLKDLSGAPKRVGGHFSCSECRQLISLTGCPETMKSASFNSCIRLKSTRGIGVADSYQFEYCKRLESLIGLPKNIKGNLYLFGCEKLRWFEGDIETVGGTLTIAGTAISYLSSSFPKKIGKDFKARKREFDYTEKEVRSVCKVGGKVHIV